MEVTKVLDSFHITYFSESPYLLQCEVDVAILLLGGDPTTVASKSGGGNQNDNDLQSIESKTLKVKSLVTFQIELCKAPKINLVGLHFRRLSGE